MQTFFPNLDKLTFQKKAWHQHNNLFPFIIPVSQRNKIKPNLESVSKGRLVRTLLNKSYVVEKYYLIPHYSFIVVLHSKNPLKTPPAITLILTFSLTLPLIDQTISLVCIIFSSALEFCHEIYQCQNFGFSVFNAGS